MTETDAALTADQLETIFHAAVKAGDPRGVEAALYAMALVDPRRAHRLMDLLDVALDVVSAARGEQP